MESAHSCRTGDSAALGAGCGMSVVQVPAQGWANQRKFSKNVSRLSARMEIHHHSGSQFQCLITSSPTPQHRRVSLHLTGVSHVTSPAFCFLSLCWAPAGRPRLFRGTRISQMPPLPAGIQHPSKGRQLLSCPGTRGLCSSSQGPESWFVQTEGPFRASGGSEGVEGSSISLVSSWQP